MNQIHFLYSTYTLLPEYLLKATNKTFDVTAINESRLLKDTNLPKNINQEIYNYSVEFTPTESHPRGTLLYINYLTSFNNIFIFICEWVRVNIYWNTKLKKKQNK